MYNHGDLPIKFINATIVEGTSIVIGWETDKGTGGKTFPWDDKNSWDFWDSVEIDGFLYDIHIDKDEYWAVAIFGLKLNTNTGKWEVDLTKEVGITEVDDKDKFKVVALPEEKAEVEVDEEEEKKKKLIDAVIEQIKEDLFQGDSTVLAEILNSHDNDFLENCLPEPL